MLPQALPGGRFAAAGAVGKGNIMAKEKGKNNAKGKQDKKGGRFSIRHLNRWQTALIAVVCVVVVLAAVYGIGKLMNPGAFEPGNADKYTVAQTEALDDSPLEGQTIIFLGSSVTYGYASNGESFVDFLEKRDGITAVKEAVSGTTLVDEESDGKASYVSRMKTIDTDIEADAFVCQLSTNDASQGKELGGISDSYDPEDFDVLTITGAIEYIIAYARQTWDCEVIFYTCPQFASDDYQAMVDRLFELQEKWDFDIIDLWNDEEFNDVSALEHRFYMVDSYHPTAAGYREWWLPEFEEGLALYLGLE